MSSYIGFGHEHLRHLEVVEARCNRGEGIFILRKVEPTRGGALCTGIGRLNGDARGRRGGSGSCATRERLWADARPADRPPVFPDHNTGTGGPHPCKWPVKSFGQGGIRGPIITHRRKAEEGDSTDTAIRPHDRYFHHEGAPVGSQISRSPNTTIISLENWLRGLPSEWPPGTGAFLHLKNLRCPRLTCTANMALPMVLTPTDFWPVCPTTQLPLPDGQAQGSGSTANPSPPCDRKQCRQPIPGGSCANADSLLAGVIRACSTVVTGDVAPFSCVHCRSGRFHPSAASLLDQMFVPTRFMGHLFEANGLTAARDTQPVRH